MTIIENATEAAEAFNLAMKQLYPQFMAKASIRKILGNCLVVDFANVSSADKAPNGIILNASGHMRFMMHLSTSRGDLPDGSPVDLELLTWHHESRNAGLKFRKIKGKTPAEALDKLYKWFDKNSDIIKSI